MIKNIAHAGGSLYGLTHTNAYEVSINSIKWGFKVIEYDIVKVKDGFIFAHDGKEEYYFD